MLIENKNMRDKVHVFSDRKDAGSELAELLKSFKKGDAIVLTIPAGGLPVGAVLACELGLDMEVAVVSKVTFPNNPEAGFGAVAFDGTLKLNNNLLASFNLPEEDIKRQIAETKEKVKRRVAKFRGGEKINLKGKEIILVDDGVASGFTTKTAIEAVKNCRAEKVYIAVPTGHSKAIKALEDDVEKIYCPNVRGGYSFAIASAYVKWRDISEDEAYKIFRDFKNRRKDDRK